MERIEIVEENGLLYARKEDGTMFNIFVYDHESPYCGYLFVKERKDGEQE